MGRLGGPVHSTQPDWDLEATAGVVLDEYRRQISATIDAADAQGVPVILVTVVSNLFEYPLIRKFWSRAFLPRKKTPPVWLAPFRQGLKLARAGDNAAALEQFQLARDSLWPPGRAPSALNEVLREIAAERGGVELVDFERELERLGVEEGIGCNFFGTDAYCDNLHTNPRTNRLIGRAVANKVRELHDRLPDPDS